MQMQHISIYGCRPNQYKKACSEDYKCVSYVVLAVADGQPEGLPVNQI